MSSLDDQGVEDAAILLMSLGEEVGLRIVENAVRLGGRD